MNYYSSLMKEMLDDETYRHSRRVAEAAVKLAEHYGIDPGKAKLAAIVHDYGKRYSRQELIQKANQLGLKLDRITRQQEKLLHAPVGAALLESELKILDPEVAGAVAYHTTGRIGMTLLEKILYLADFIEEGRRYEGVEFIRKAAYSNLERALLAAVDMTIKSVVARGLLLHPRSVAFRNRLLEEITNDPFHK